MPQMSKIFLYLFFGLTAINLLAEFSASTWLIFSTKPFLMICLSIWFYTYNKDHPTAFRNFILLGFIFSIFGDTFLMFNENGYESEIFFLLGLGSFLITHLCYLIGFIKLANKRKGFLAKQPLLLIPFLFFLIANNYFLWPDVPAPLRLAVVIYSTVIISMTIGCLNLNGLIASRFFKILLTGVLLFVLSDSIIGLNKFKSHEILLPYPRLLIMIPYLLSQYLIGMGSSYILQNEK